MGSVDYDSHDYVSYGVEYFRHDGIYYQKSSVKPRCRGAHVGIVNIKILRHESLKKKRTEQSE